jgi:TRAP transporter TAXI family solute receptor
MAAEQTGAWYALAVGITQAMKKTMPDLATVSILPGGGISNAVGIDRGQAQLGFSQASSIVDALKGTPPFPSRAENLRYVLSLFPHKTHVVVPADSGIDDFTDLRGRHINVGPRGLLSEDIARRILDGYGMSYDEMASVQNLSFSDSVVQMKDGRLDALFWTSPAPFAVLTDLAQSRDIRILTIPERHIARLTAENGGLSRATIRAGSYTGVDYDVITVESALVLIAGRDAPDDLVYAAAKVVAENLPELKQISPYLADIEPASLFRDFGVPAHPAAERYFREAGLLGPDER